MAKIRLTKEFSFEMSHALEGYDGACSQIHGHSYRFFVTVVGEPETDASDPKYGMVMDFRELKKIVKELIIDVYDHALLLRGTELDRQLQGLLTDKYNRTKIVDFQPTCENLISMFAQMISAALPERVKLHSLRLHETATSFAEWFSEDNL